MKPTAAPRPRPTTTGRFIRTTLEGGAARHCPEGDPAAEGDRETQSGEATRRYGGGGE